jgi:hypothetical protein
MGVLGQGANSKWVLMVPYLKRLPMYDVLLNLQTNIYQKIVREDYE